MLYLTLIVVVSLKVYLSHANTDHTDLPSTMRVLMNASEDYCLCRDVHKWLPQLSFPLQLPLIVLILNTEM